MVNKFYIVGVLLLSGCAQTVIEAQTPCGNIYYTSDKEHEQPSASCSMSLDGTYTLSIGAGASKNPYADIAIHSIDLAKILAEKVP